MAKFHAPIPTPKEVSQIRLERYKMTKGACYRGIAVRGSIIIAELIGFAFTQSQALWLDALATTLDIGFSLFLVGSIKYASRPPDKNHPFGHGRFEPIAGLQLSLILIVLGAILAFHQFKESWTPPERQFPFYTFMIPFVGGILMELCHRLLKRVAIKGGSAALLADAYHFRSDALSNVIAATALGTGLFMPRFAGMLDLWGAFFIALLMIVTGSRATKENLHQLLDKKPSKDYLDKIIQAACKISGVLGTEKLRVQKYGPDAHVDIDIEVDPDLSVMKAHRIAQEVRASIQVELPEVQDVMVHVEPYFESDH